eukprot:m.1144040 g.1144040  ORF g.1144040 m.1144040 type:complete len:58 (-) comp24461_c0_seq10:1643-1816(-)
MKQPYTRIHISSHTNEVAHTRYTPRAYIPLGAHTTGIGHTGHTTTPTQTHRRAHQRG